MHLPPQLEAKKICQYLGIHTKTITGGKTKKMMLDPPMGEVDIVIGSFGVLSKLTTTNIYKLNMVRHLVLDEADALFHETFEDKLRIFLKRIPVCSHIFYNRVYSNTIYMSKCNNLITPSSVLCKMWRIPNCQ